MEIARRPIDLGGLLAGTQFRTAKRTPGSKFNGMAATWPATEGAPESMIAPLEALVTGRVQAPVIGRRAAAIVKGQALV